MAVPRVKNITVSLRNRVERALEMGALKSGDRLPSARELAREFEADPRVILAAYRTLAEEGLIDIRPRSGNYVSKRNVISRDADPPPTPLVVDILSQAITRGYSTKEFAGYLADASFGRRMRAVVIAGTSDQAEGIARELRDDFSVSAEIVSPDSVRQNGETPKLRGSDLIITTENFGVMVGGIARKLGKPMVVMSVRDNIISEEWAALMLRGVNVVAADRKFLTILRAYLSSSPHSNAVKMFVAGEDSLDSIEPGTATYITQAARIKLGKTRLPGTLVPPPRVLSEACVRSILNVIVSLRYDRKVPSLS